MAVFRRSAKVLFILAFSFIFVIIIPADGSTADYTAQWNPSEISEIISPGDTMVKPATFILNIIQTDIDE